MNREEHRIVGGIAGGGAVLAREMQDTGLVRIDRLFGGVLGGISGSELPDRIELPTNPNHRGTFHSAGTGALLLYTWRDLVYVSDELMLLRDQALSKAQGADDFWSQLLYILGGLACGVVSGMVLGMPAGYISHLALDSTTPKSLPLI